MARIGFICLTVILLSLPAWAQQQLENPGPWGGDVRSLAVHPDQPERFFLGTADGQIFVSDDAGEHWKRIVPGLNRRSVVVDNLIFDPRDPDTLYAGTWELKSDRGWLFRTQDGGRTWEEISLGHYARAIRAVAVAPSNPEVIAAGISEGVIVTLDGGKNWTRITRGYRSLYYIESLAFDPRDENTLYAGTRRLAWKTSDLGKKWEPIHKGMIFDSHVMSLLVAPRNPDLLYASACTGVYRSENRGLEWTKLENGLPKVARRTRMLRLDPSDPNTIYAGTTEGLFVSHNGGISWRQLFSKVVVNAIAVHPRRRQVVLVGTDDAGVLKSLDEGTTFATANRGFIHRQIRALTPDPHHPEDRYFASVAADAHHGGFLVSSDGGTHWEAHNEGLAQAVADIRTILPSRTTSTIYLGTHKGLFVGVPAREPWKPIKGTQGFIIYDMAFAGQREEGLFLGTGAGLFHLSIPSGQLAEIPIPEYGGKVAGIVYEPSSKQLLIATEAGVLRSINGGKSWTGTSAGLPHVPVHILRKTGKRLFAGIREGLFLSEDAGQTWQRCEGIYSVDVVALEADPEDHDRLFAADVTGHLYRSSNGGSTWRIMDLDFPISTVATLAFTSTGNLMAGTISDGIYVISSPREAAADGRDD